MALPKKRPATVVPKYLAPEAVCEIYSLSLTKLYRLIDDGRIRSLKIDRSRLVDVKSVEALFAESVTGTGGPDSEISRRAARQRWARAKGQGPEAA